MIQGINNHSLINSYGKTPSFPIEYVRLLVLCEVLQAVLDSWKNVRESIRKQAEDSSRHHKKCQEGLRRKKGMERQITHLKEAADPRFNNLNFLAPTLATRLK